MKKIEKYLRDEKGAVTTVVVVTLLFFVIILSTTYIIVATLRKNQLKSQLIAREIYEKDLNIKIGDYVNYTYDIAQNYVLISATCGSSDNPTDGIPQTKDLKWKILSINADGSIDLISETPTNTAVYFSGALGYNNGVYLINDICAKQYSSKSLGVTARSLTIEDIEAKMNATGIAARNAFTDSTSGIQYGKTKTYKGDYSYYPNLYAKENGSGINTTTVKNDGIGRSNKYYTKPTTETYSQANTSGLTVTQDYYYFSNNSYFDDSNFYSTIFGTGSAYWVASRYSYCFSTHADFGLRRVDGTWLGALDMFNSSKYANNFSSHLRPVVSLSLYDIDFSLGKDTSGAWQIRK